MRKSVMLSIIASTMVMAGGTIVPVEPVVEAPVVVEEESTGKVSGQFRAFYLDRTYSGSIVNNRNSLAVGGWIGYDTASWNGLSAGAKFYVTEGISIHDGPLSSANYDISLYGDNFTDYGFIGEAYLNYAMGNTNIKIGRQKLNTPLVGADDARMIPNLFEAAVLTNNDIADTTLMLGHITRETVGTFGNVYGGLSDLAIQSGYGVGYKLGTNGEFANMGDIALGQGTNTAGVTVGSVIYKGIEGLELQAWDYYAHDIMNAIYLQGDYGFNVSDAVKMKASAQYINQSEVGDALAGDVDSNYWSAKLGASMGSLSGYVAYSQTADSDGAMNGGVLSPWGGMPAFTQGMVTRHQFFSDTTATKVAATYNLNDLTGLNLKASAYFVSFDVGDTATYATGLTSEESGFDIQYQATTALNLRFRGNFPTDFGETDNGPYNWDEYRLIANYNF